VNFVAIPCKKITIPTMSCYSLYAVGPGFISTSPAIIRRCLLRQAMRREGARSHPVTLPSLPLNTPTGAETEQMRLIHITGG